jgi:NADH-quinone oxidoreductase subunit L
MKEAIDIQPMILACIILLPLAGYLLLSFIPKVFYGQSGGIVASGLVGLSFILSLVLFFYPDPLFPKGIEFFPWIVTSGFEVSFSLQADPLSLVMMMLVTGVSTLIHVYSIGYMREDANFNRFFAYLNLFVFFMLLLVMSDNFLLLFAGWEGVGLCSYLLIGFWFRNPEYAKAANKAFIMNRIGDLGFLLGIAMLFITFGSLSFGTIENLLHQGTGLNNVTVIALLLLVGAVGKSAQIPLFTWLPDAMAGPTPVSALIHAATMVTAGIYLVIRARFLFILSPLTMHILAVTGIVTALFAGTVALKQNDIKKILAYSTVSQLGLMFFSLGLGAFDAALFHLLTHAFFKALLFLCAGSVIHALHGQQDIRQMGGLKSAARITFITMITGALAISGIPPFSGFFSKDGILAAAWHTNSLWWIPALTVSLLTAFYMFRLIYLVFYGTYRGEMPIEKVHESPAVMTVPLISLAFLSLTGGIMDIPRLFGGHLRLSGFLGSEEIAAGTNPAVEWTLVIITVIAVSLTIYYSYSLYCIRQKVPLSDAGNRGIAGLLARKYYVDEVYETVITRPLSWLSERLFSVVEIRIVDAMVEGAGRAVIALSRTLRYIQSGSISFYLLFMVLGIIVVLVFNLFL